MFFSKSFTLQSKLTVFKDLTILYWICSGTPWLVPEWIKWDKSRENKMQREFLKRLYKQSGFIIRLTG